MLFAKYISIPVSGQADRLLNIQTFKYANQNDADRLDIYFVGSEAVTTLEHNAIPGFPGNRTMEEWFQEEVSRVQGTNPIQLTGFDPVVMMPEEPTIMQTVWTISPPPETINEIVTN